MAMAQAAFSNNSSSLLQARNDRYINDVLASPMQPWRMNLGYMLGGVFRSFAIGISLVVIALRPKGNRRMVGRRTIGVNRRQIA